MDTDKNKKRTGAKKLTSSVGKCICILSSMCKMMMMMRMGGIEMIKRNQGSWIFNVRRRCHDIYAIIEDALLWMQMDEG